MSANIWAGAVPRHHVVTFYERDDELVATVARFVGDGLLAGETGIVLATGSHLIAVESELNRLGFDVGAASRRGTIVTVDADDARVRHTVSGTFDSAPLIGEMRALVSHGLDMGPRVRVFGELVVVLWDNGEVAAALELEDAWNSLSRELPIALLCAYPGAVGMDDRQAASMCAAHVERLERARTFDCVLQAPGAARRFVARTLREWGRADLLDDAAIVTAELTTNAVLHARTEFVVAITGDGEHVRLSVRDASTVAPVLAESTVDSISGRGLWLVGTISRRWGTERLPGGKVVWADLS